MLVTGNSGVGKSSLIAELRSMVTAKSGWFVQGKFDQYSQDESTNAVGQVMRALARLLLAEPEDQLLPLQRTQAGQGRNPVEPGPQRGAALEPGVAARQARR